MKERRYPYAPLWVNWVYRWAEWIDFYGPSFIATHTRWRYSFLDRHCRCCKCEDRRARGIQK